MSGKLNLTGRSIWVPELERHVKIAEPDIGVFVFVRNKHSRTGVPKDPWACAVAKASRDTMGALAAMIGSTVAYIVVRIDGQEVALRYGVPKKTREALHAFDRTHLMPEDGFTFTPIRMSDRAESKRMRQKRERYRWGTKGKTRPATGVRRMMPHDVRSAAHTINTITSPVA